MASRIGRLTEPASALRIGRRAQDASRDRRTVGRAGTWRRYVAPVLLLAAWQTAASIGLVSTETLASPWQILRTGWSLMRDGTLPANILVSLIRASCVLLLAVVVGVVMALIAGLSRLGEDAVDATMQMGRTMPILALVPLFILWFGIGETPKVLLVALGALFPIYLNLFKGVRSIDPKLLEMARTLGLSRWQTIREVILPGALPDFLLGLRFAVGVSWLMLVVAEQINATSGIGHMMMDAQDFLRTDIILVGLFIYAAFGLISDQMLRSIEARTLSWRPGSR